MGKMSSLPYSGTKLEQKLLLVCDAHQVKNMNICKGKVISMEKSKVLENKPFWQKKFKRMLNIQIYWSCVLVLIKLKRLAKLIIYMVYFLMKKDLSESGLSLKLSMKFRANLDWGNTNGDTQTTEQNICFTQNIFQK